MNLKFSDFDFVFINYFVKNLAQLHEWIISYFIDFNHLQTKMKQNNPIININTKVFLKKGHWNSQKSEKQRKSKTDVYNLTKASKNLDSCKKCWHMTTSEKYRVKFKKVFFLLPWSFLYVRQVSSQYIVVVYPEKRMLGVISLSFAVSDYEVKIREW